MEIVLEMTCQHSLGSFSDGHSCGGTPQSEDVAVIERLKTVTDVDPIQCHPPYMMINTVHQHLMVFGGIPFDCTSPFDVHNPIRMEKR